MVSFLSVGLPKSVVSDNAAYFRSDEFEQFLHQNGVNTQLLPLTILPPMA